MENSKIADKIRDIINDEAIHVTVADSTFELATRWRPRCHRCARDIRTGDIGPAGYNHSCLNCGAWNLPAWVDADLDADLAEDVVKAVAALKAEIADQVAEATEELRDRLTVQLADHLTFLREAGIPTADPGADWVDPETELGWADAVADVTGHHPRNELDPGVFMHEGRWVSWDVSPDSHGEDYTLVEVEEEEAGR